MFKWIGIEFEEIDFLVLNDYISMEEGNKKTDQLLKEKLRCGFYKNFEGYYETV